ncbi:amino acid adenylation domain-containing protein, partial [Amycolatopsis minnesotensis]|uniref:amino acid adenylation domain-containing protein n=1 Tax=Amycolatopsis minnesotensis TaxID=337894 RepID=UPI0031DA27A4
MNAPSGRQGSETARERALRRLAGQAAAAPAREEIPKLARDHALPLSSAQQRLWFMYELEPGAIEYNSTRVLRLIGEVDEPALAVAVNWLVERHEPLRTTFESEDGNGVQTVRDAVTIPLERTDLPTSTQDEVHRYLEAEVSRTFDLRTGPVFRAGLARLGPREHLLVLSMHHIVADGWSMGVLASELDVLYSAATRGVRADLLPLLTQYADFASWQRARLSEPAVDRQLAYWRAHLAELTPLDLPTDRPRPAVRSAAGAVHEFTVDAAVATRLKELGRERGVTVFTTLVAAAQVLLARYTGQDDVAIGTATSGRTRVELESLIGFFVNTLVIRSTVDERKSFSDLMDEVQATVLAAFSNQEVPFQRLVETLQPERDPSRPPLVDVAVNLHNAGTAPVRLTGLEVTEVAPPVLAANLDLVFDFTEQDGALAGALTYNTTLFTAATAERLAHHLITLLTAVASEPARRLEEISLLTPSEHQTVAEEWPGRGRGPARRTVPALFADQVAANPSAVAAVFGTHQLTYAELDQRANRLARLLSAHGAGPEQVVAISVPRSLDMLVAVLAVAKSGAAYLPLDAGYPAARIRYLLDDATPLLTLTTQLTADRLPPEAPTIQLDEPATVAALADLPDTAFAVPLDPANAAYVIHTSGSTGRPKAVVVTHAGASGMVTAQRAGLGAGAGTRVLQFASLSFDAAFWELGMSVLSGGTLVLAPADAVLPGDPLAALIAEHAITHLTLPPTALAALRGDAIPTGTTLVLAGEACPPNLVRAWSDGRRMVNAYGPTESTVCASMSEALTAADCGGTSVHIGRPLPSVGVYVLDSRLHPSAVNVPGELYLAGDGLARGYLGQEGLTATRFVADPIAGGRMYRTGDRGRWSADGTLEILGRTDDQVKVRGFRIELGEVEAALSAHPAAAGAAAAVKPDVHGTPRLMGYLAAGADGPSVAELRAFLRERLPEHMVPSSLVVLDELPVTVSGKVDRRALPGPSADRDLETEFVAPRTRAERILAAVWAELLGVDRVSVLDNFFDLGGDSILGLRVVARARDAGVRVTPKQTFLRPTIAELAAVADFEDGGTAAEQNEVTGDVALTPIHHWFFENLEQSIDRFNQSVYVELAEDVDERALRTAVSALVTHHDALRLRVTTVDGTWREYNAPAENAEVLATFESASASEEEIRSAILAAQTGFRLDTGPLLRGLYFPAAAGGKPRLFLTAHHLVVDGVSLRVLLSDLDTAYQQAARGEQVDLGAKTTSFRAWSHGLAALVASGALDQDAEYWARQEDSVVAAGPLPQDGDGPNTVGSSHSVSARLDADTTTSLLRRVPESYRTRVNDVLLSALSRVLSTWTGGSIAPIALEGHGRDDLVAGTDLSRTVGWFTSLYPVALQVPATPDWGRTIKSVKEQLRAVPGHGISYGALRYLGNTADPLGGRSEPGVAFNYHGRFDAGGDSGLVRALLPEQSVERHPEQPRQHLIEVTGAVRDGELAFHWTYSANRHDRATIQRLADEFTGALAEIVEHCAQQGTGGCTPSDFPLADLDQDAVDRIAGDGKSIEDVYPLTPMQSGMLFHSLSTSGRDVYTGHFGMTLDGVTDPHALATAWQRVVDRTPVLRTSIRWQDLAEPLQIVHREAKLPVTHLDWRSLPDEQRRENSRELWESRGGERLSLDAPPLLRMTFARLTDESVQVFWDSHHILSDGWSFSEVLSEVFAEYGALTGGTATSPVVRRPYRDYVQWLSEQDLSEAEEHWRNTLAGLTEPTALPYDHTPVHAHVSRSSREIRAKLSTTDSKALYEFAKRERLTVNTLVQGAWALLLSRHADDRDVCFGATVSGRPAELSGADTMVGLFINMLPVRVTTDTDERVATWLRNLQDAQLDARRHEYVPLHQVQTWSEIERGVNLFDSVVVFENYPYDDEAAGRHGIAVREFLGDEHTNYALVLTAFAGEQLELALGFDPELFDEASVRTLLDRLDVVLSGLRTTEKVWQAELERTASGTGIGTGPVVSVGCGVVERLLWWVGVCPGGVAVRDGGG